MKMKQLFYFLTFILTLNIVTSRKTDTPVSQINNSTDILQNINQTSGKISELLRLLHLKMKGIQKIDEKIKIIDPKSANSETDKLKLALEKEKKGMTKVMKNIQKKQNELIQTVTVNDKKTNRNKNKLKDLLTFINLQVKGQMSLPYFKQAFSKFLIYIVSLANTFTSAQLKNYQATAVELTNKHWKKYLEEAKAFWEESENKKPRKGNKRDRRESNKANKSGNKSEKKSKNKKKEL